MSEKVLFVCIGNSGRSQMAEAFANRLGAGIVEARSAGTRPSDGLDPDVVAAMQEIGYDMAGQYPKPLTPEMEEWADRIVSMGCGVQADSAEGTCPVFFLPTEDWPLQDPHHQAFDKVRQIRDGIKTRVEALIAQTRVSVEEG